MKEAPLRTTVIGSYPFPAWLEFACANLAQFGEADRTELIEDAVRIAVGDQVQAGLDVITDGEQTRLDFNLRSMAFSRGSNWNRRPRAASGPRLMINAGVTGSPASCARRAGWVRWKISPVCAGSHPRVRF